MSESMPDNRIYIEEIPQYLAETPVTVQNWTNKECRNSAWNIGKKQNFMPLEPDACVKNRRAGDIW